MRVLIILALVAIWSSECVNLIPLTSTDNSVPYGLYSIRSKWGCEMKDPRCDEELAIVYFDEEDEAVLTLADDESSLWEIIPSENGLYQILSRAGCEEVPTAQTCNAWLSHRNGVAELDRDYIAYWVIQKTGSGYWQIRSENVGERGDQVLSFDQPLEYPEIQLLEDDSVEWELLLDMDAVESQNLGDVEYDLTGVDISKRDLNLLTEESHNVGLFETTNSVSLEYAIEESHQFTDWSGFVLPIDTQATVSRVIFTDEGFEVTEEMDKVIQWRHAQHSFINAEHSEDVSIPPKSYRVMRVVAKEATFAVPFNGVLTHKFSTGRFSTQVVRGVKDMVQVYSVDVQVGDAVSLVGQEARDKLEEAANNIQEQGAAAAVLAGGQVPGNMDPGQQGSLEQE